jgi:hypothetical protein
MGQVRKPEHPLNVMICPAPSPPPRFARGSQALYSPCREYQAFEVKRPRNLWCTTARTEMRALAVGKERGAGALQTKSCRGLLLYYSTCLYLLLLRLRVAMHGHALGGNERVWMTGQREGKRRTGKSHWNQGRKWNSKWCISMKSEKTDRALRALLILVRSFCIGT